VARAPIRDGARVLRTGRERSEFQIAHNGRRCSPRESLAIAQLSAGSGSPTEDLAGGRERAREGVAGGDRLKLDVRRDACRREVAGIGLWSLFIEIDRAHVCRTATKLTDVISSPAIHVALSR